MIDSVMGPQGTRTSTRRDLRADDGRQRDYVLTAKGRRTLDALGADRERAIDAVWRGLDRKELEAFSTVSQSLIRGIESLAAAAKTEPR